MKEKHRHNNENQLSKPCNQIKNYRTDTDGKLYCRCYDGTYIKSDGTIGTILEMSKPWCNPDGEDGCKCNPFMCLKMKNRWFASLSHDKQERLKNGQLSCWRTRK